MKTAPLPALRVDPKREAAEPAARETEDDFLARGQYSAQQARRDKQYVSAADVVAKLEKKLSAAERKG